MYCKNLNRKTLFKKIEKGANNGRLTLFQGAFQIIQAVSDSVIHKLCS